MVRSTTSAVIVGSQGGAVTAAAAADGAVGWAFLAEGVVDAGITVAPHATAGEIAVFGSFARRVLNSNSFRNSMKLLRTMRAQV